VPAGGVVGTVVGTVGTMGGATGTKRSEGTGPAAGAWNTMGTGARTHVAGAGLGMRAMGAGGVGRLTSLGRESSVSETETLEPESTRCLCSSCCGICRARPGGSN